MKKIIDSLHSSHLNLSLVAQLFQPEDEAILEINKNIDKNRDRLQDIRDMAK